MRPSPIPLTLQTTYAELLERASAAAFDDAFPKEGSFTPKTVRHRRYWYFQEKTKKGRPQRYVGAETPELLERIRHFKQARDDRKERQTLVSTLIRSAHLPRPNPKIGDLVAALANAGVFRLRGVLVGTVAYQTYSAMLGERLPSAATQTMDVDVAQFSNISVAIKDNIPPLLDVLKKVDASFREVPHAPDSRYTVSYASSKGLRVDFLTPNEGADSDSPARLPALGTYAQPSRFLDFLIHEPEPAVLLHNAGVFVLVPSPQRYALHKLIVARRRQLGNVKSNKDLLQAEALLNILVDKRPHDLRYVWQEAYERGPKWRQLLGEGLGEIQADKRDKVLKAVGSIRSIVPNLDLQFHAPVARYDFERDVVTFLGEAGGVSIRCAISREALDDHFHTSGLSKEGRLKIFRENRETIEHLARIKFLDWPIKEPDAILIKSADVAQIRANKPSSLAGR